jgi:hypothetical protein
MLTDIGREMFEESDMAERSITGLKALELIRKLDTLLIPVIERSPVALN